MTRTCENCEWWERYLGRLSGYGICHRMPPTAILEDGEVWSMAPETSCETWCGEFKQKDKEE